ncbi:uncharacterized protein LOC142639892 [Castanea sativa]|uniref:uncharacterized protein LOC142639892 n=1 Tax=Castanea sativa TaxID=21020 RepID=UPI003F653ACA
MEPPASPISVQDQWTVSLNMALVIDEIWRSRNLKQFCSVMVDVMSAKRNIHSRFFEIVKVFTPDMSTPMEHVSYRWNPPPQGWIKLNVDAALNNHRLAFAVVARDQLGEVLSLWGKIHLACPLAQAEAEALYWAVQLAIKKGWKNVIFEGNAKNCTDALTSADAIPDWLSCNTVSNIRCLVNAFDSVKFSWVRRSGNSVAHAAAKLSLNFCLDFCFFKGLKCKVIILSKAAIVLLINQVQLF